MQYNDSSLRKKLYKPFSNDIENTNYFHFIRRVLLEDKLLLVTMMIYGVAISILSLATPISVQLLINSVSFTAMLQPILVLGAILLLMVTIYGLLNILQFFISEIFQRRFFARMSYEVGMSLLNSDHKAFEEANQTEMVNRFFETTTIQKTIPKLFSKTFTVLLQSFAGLLLIACYHPFFLVFSFGIPLAILIIWKIFASKSIKHSFLESRRKYDLVGWFEDIARNRILFKSKQGRNYAKFKIDFLTGLYISERKIHFKGLFYQVILLFVLYAISTALLLVLGGWLVLKNQLTLGQLVASELVISAIVYNISGLGRDFESFYDLIASTEKLSQFQNIPHEVVVGKNIPAQINEIKFENVLYRYMDHEYKFNFNFLVNNNYLILTNGYSTKKIINELILGFRTAISGKVTINEEDLNNFDKYDLRSRIEIIDNSPLIEGTIREYLTFNNSNISDNYLMTILETVGISEFVLKSKDKLDLRIIPSGWPLSESEKILLKVARSLIHKPQVIIANEVLDMLETRMREQILYHLTKENQAIFIYFSHRFDNTEKFDKKIFVEKMFSQEVKNIDDFNKIQKS